MKLKNSEIFVAREPLQKLLGEKFPVKTSYGIAKIANKLNDQFKVIEDVRQGLIKKYGETDEQGNIRVKPEDKNWNEFVEEFNELMNQEVEIVFEKVKLPETTEIDSQTVMVLMPFIEV